nr:alpha/beta hydrolase-fold protein [Thiomicrorhabdus indica]
MTFSVYLPPQAETQSVPALYWLSGLTCTDDNVIVKAGAQRYAAEHGIALVMPDTSPRGEEVSDEPDHYDLGENNQQDWPAYDAVELIANGAYFEQVLVDQGTANEFLTEGQLQPESLQKSCEDKGIQLQLRMQEGYDHSYHFIATFIGEHIAYHAKALLQK